jgi:hypothetical protein
MESKYFSFKKLFWASLFCVIPFSLLESFLALFNVVGVDFNGVLRYGIVGFIIPILFIPFIGFLFSGLCWLLLNFGNILYYRFLKLIKKK